MEDPEKRREAHLEKRRVWRRRYRQTWAGRYTKYKERAKALGRDFELTKEDFEDLEFQHCTYCGDLEPAGFDRVDSDLGYTKDNSVPCCTFCNRLKLDHPLDEWLAKLEQIVDYMNS